ncbi:hypothetical protein Cadr_000001452 [Camelus dromedarius]|uniref:Uncharacterized protein n=1 Tax=Camelus dromedarius TaxID=9838 RepID=A0A5N4EFC5_CAMDR|nr:hypothetical protein Cadr_000001452 [Camelus dromedarius]
MAGGRVDLCSSQPASLRAWGRRPGKRALREW